MCYQKDRHLRVRRPFSYFFGPRVLGTREIPFIMLARLNIAKLNRNLEDSGEKALLTNIPFEYEEEYVLRVASKFG